jgi:ketosteroid isomerase-like protein
MKNPTPKLSMIVPLALLLALILIVYFSSCSKPNRGDIVREHIKAVNNDDVKKNLTFFADDIVFEMAAPEQYRQFSGKFTGKDQLRNLMEWDVTNNARLTINDMKVDGNTVIVKLTEKNEGWRLLGIEERPFTATYKFRGRLLEKVKLEFSLDNAKLLGEKFKPFAEWASKEHPQEFNKMATSGYSAEGARFYLSLAKEWRDKTLTERLSVEQELIKLENEWAEAWVKSDIAFHDRIMADDYTWTAPQGFVMTKADDLTLIKSGQDVITLWVLADMKVRIYGDAAVVTGRDTIKETYKGKDVSGQNRWTHTWVKRDGRWQCVAGHSSEIAQK